MHALEFAYFTLGVFTATVVFAGAVCLTVMEASRRGRRRPGFPDAVRREPRHS